MLWSPALLAEPIHNFGDALTAVPLGIAFFLRSARGEKLAGYTVVLAIFVSACVALYETIQRLIHPEDLAPLDLGIGVIGFIGNEIAAQVRLRGGRRLNSPALIADGNHAHVDGFVSLEQLGSALLVALGDRLPTRSSASESPLSSARITWDLWRTISASDHHDP